LLAVIVSAVIEECGSDSTLKTLLNNISLTDIMNINTDLALKSLLNRIVQTDIKEHSCVKLETLSNNISSANNNTALANYSIVRDLYLVDSVKTNILISDVFTNQHCYSNNVLIQTQLLDILETELILAIVSQSELLVNNRDSIQLEQIEQTFQHL
jgi:hypothetical protein